MASEAEIKSKIKTLRDNISFLKKNAALDKAILDSGQMPYGPLTPGYRKELEGKYQERMKVIKEQEASIKKLEKQLPK